MDVPAKVPPPGLPGGGNKGLNWEQSGPDTWLAPDGKERAPARITHRTNAALGKTFEAYYCYRNSAYLGTESALREAKRRVDKGEAKPLAEKDTVDGHAGHLLACCELTKEEAKWSWHQWRVYRMSLPPELKIRMRPEFMKNYENMTVEALNIEYEKLVERAREVGIDRFRPHKFKDKEEGLKFIEAIESSLRARAASEKAVTEESKLRKPSPAKEIPTPQEATKETTSMATNGKKAAKKAGKKAAKKAKAAKKPAEAKAPRPGKLGAFLDAIGIRAESKAEKAATALFNSLGKPMKTEALCKAVYGKAEINDAIGGVLNGLRGAIEKAKASYNVKRDRTEGTVGLYSGTK